MREAHMIKDKAWCSRPGCAYPTALASVGANEDGTLNARLHGRRWQRDGSVEGMEKYAMVPYRNAKTRIRADGREEKRFQTRWRVDCPVAVVCGCGHVQAIGLTSHPIDGKV